MTSSDKLYSYLRYIDAEPSMDTFQQRKRMQKLVYLMKEFGAGDINFYFTWYLHGPYSPGLTRTLFDMIENPEIQLQEVRLTHEEQKKLDRLKAMLKDDMNSISRLELLASLHYLKKINKEYKASKEEIVSILKEKKPQFTDEEIEYCWEKLSQTS